MEPEQVFGLVVSSVTRARNYTDNVEWSSEDGTRIKHDCPWSCLGWLRAARRVCKDICR
jgi:2-isopropylmalate synthase